MRVFSIRKTKIDKYKPLYGERITEIDSVGDIYSNNVKTTNLLQKLRRTSSVAECIEILVDEHPDVSMARQMLLSLANQGGTIEFNAPNSSEILHEWEIFCSQLNSVSASGLDGLILQATDNFIVRSGIGYEIVVKKGLENMEVYLIDPKTLMWKLETDKKTYTPYQVINGKQINLSKGNFRWIPFNPKVGSPKGTYLFQSVITAADMQLEFFSASQTVLYRAGMPRYKVVVDLEKTMASAPPDVRSDVTGELIKKYLSTVISGIKNNLQKIGVKNDFVITSNMSIDTVGVNNSAFFQGISSFAEVIDTQIMNGLKVLSTLMNRHQQGGSYALSTVEFKSVVDMLAPVQRAIKRMVEDIARTWLQINGYMYEVKYTPNPIEWQTFKDKVDYQLSKQELFRRGEEYGHISPDEATKNTFGHDKAYNPTENLFAYVKVEDQNIKDGENNE